MIGSLGKGSRLALAALRASRLGRVNKVGSTRCEGSGKHPRLAEGSPERRGLLDQALDASKLRKSESKQFAARGGRLQIIIQPQFGVCPVMLVRFIADREIEKATAPLGGPPEELVQVRAAWAEACKLSVCVTRQDQIIAISELQSHARRGNLLADVKTADMNRAPPWLDRLPGSRRTRDDPA